MLCVSRTVTPDLASYKKIRDYAEINRDLVLGFFISFIYYILIALVLYVIVQLGTEVRRY